MSKSLSERYLEVTCQRCGHEWRPFVPSPKQCPECHSPGWRVRAYDRQKTEAEQEGT